MGYLQSLGANNLLLKVPHIIKTMHNTMTLPKTIAYQLISLYQPGKEEQGIFAANLRSCPS